MPRSDEKRNTSAVWLFFWQFGQFFRFVIVGIEFFLIFFIVQSFLRSECRFKGQVVGLRWGKGGGVPKSGEKRLPDRQNQENDRPTTKNDKKKNP